MKNNYQKEKRTNLRLIWISFISGFILLLFSVKCSFSELPTRSSIVEVKGIVKDLKIKKGRRSKTLIINLNEYPEINFMIGDLELNQSSLYGLMNDNKQGDSIMFFIEKHEYYRKIVKSEKIPFPGNFLYKKNISIVEIHNKNTPYLSLKDYNESHRNNNYLAIALLGFFGVLMLFVGIKGVQYYRKTFR
ncbi:hypothetical protein [Chryseobacterium shigense]|uniref:Uncharacterized protein n=1 Tax=Chryseobacterium shigense TaxID=297244 RepID=A0A841MY27_9FLAO|nr:hypothetical protein [Chryseobacterium shigense]MBB6369444.1 hypothetical protein [Chryseobacterium shigense]